MHKSLFFVKGFLMGIKDYSLVTNLPVELELAVQFPSLPFQLFRVEMKDFADIDLKECFVMKPFPVPDFADIEQILVLNFEHRHC